MAPQTPELEARHPRGLSRVLHRVCRLALFFRRAEHTHDGVLSFFKERLQHRLPESRLSYERDLHAALSLPTADCLLVKTQLQVSGSLHAGARMQKYLNMPLLSKAYQERCASIAMFNA
jgi:hypothetical protein